MEQQPIPETAHSHPLANYQFSSEELRVLRQCNSESFFQRSLPMSIGFGTATYLSIKSGYLKPNVKFGTLPKIALAAIFGYFLGKFSYQEKCAEKIMQLPNSRLAEMLRARKNQSSSANLGMGMALTPFMPPSDEIMENARSSALNLDVENRPAISGLDDIYRPSLDTQSNYFEEEQPIEPVKPNMTYEELRIKNREEYNKKYHSQTAVPSIPDIRSIQQSEPLRTYKETDNVSGIKGQKNKYGDTWTE